ncbi:MAG: recombinase family protein [Desulfobacterales bacterium]|nr:recombinase family protein [Desulfobacterales bacterium]
MKAVGYIRVSSLEQVEGESLQAQTNEIKEFTKKRDFELVRIYEDAGISGTSMKKREGLKRILKDSEKGEFDCVLVRTISRFGRSMVDVLTNVDFLQKHEVRLISMEQDIDYSTTIGKIILSVLSGFSELENEQRTHAILSSKQERLKQGKPSHGRLPYGRILIRETGEIVLDNERAERIRWAAQEYLQGKPLQDIARKVDLSAHILAKTLKEKCGDIVLVEMQDHKKLKIKGGIYEIKVPRLLENHVIEAIKDRLNFNRTHNRSDVQQYLLTGFIRCGKCYRPLYGIAANQRRNFYYSHPTKKYQLSKRKNPADVKVCEGLGGHIKTLDIEQAVFETIRENTLDEVAFQQAIQDSLPDEEYVAELNERINKNEADLKSIDKQISRLAEAVAGGHLKPETAGTTDKKLWDRKSAIIKNIKADKAKLTSLPDLQELKQEAEQIRRALSLHYGSEEHFLEMSYDEKRQLLHFLFDGKDAMTGERYGIYVDRNPDGSFDYTISAKLFFGIRTFRNGEIDAMPYEKQKGKQKVTYIDRNKGSFKKQWSL